ncbi:MAG: hypothetical protein IT529_11115 [Burkholderiales bacterium]|nr:hypothetical protein [Burkholderiales bacterium]
MAVNRDHAPAGAGADRDPGLDRLYAAGAREAPPAHLDAAILSAARREVGAGPARRGAAFRAWRIPLAMAAVIVLGVSVVVVMRDEEPARLTEFGADPARERMPRTPAAPPQPAADGSPASSGPATGPAARRADPAAAGSVTNEPREDVAGAAGLPAGKAAKAGQTRPAARPFAESAVPATASRDEPAAVEPLVSGLPKGAQPKAVEQSAREERPDVPPPAAPAPRAAAAPGAVAAGVRQESSGTDLVANELDRRRASPEAADRSDRSAIVSERRSPWYGLEGEPAQRWAARIEELRRAGRQKEADEVLAEFRRRYPGHALPPAPGR